ncbi:MAG: pyridoxamine 5'-phosphate oxidase family protein [Frankiaceae bacterium]|jgi:nitroimidazol reductase NimA-like FMN-containing flavoprotein (pyridoxamine 5'-phosphate oxidase superfamily)
MTTAQGSTELSRSECLDLLRAGTVGRVVLTHRALPVALPVNYAVDGDSVVFRTSSATALAAAADGSVVAFEVDHVDLPSRSGWSVLITGVAREVHGSDLLRADQLRLDSWAATDSEARYVRIPLALVSGRRLQPALQ